MRCIFIIQLHIFLMHVSPWIWGRLVLFHKDIELSIQVQKHRGNHSKIKDKRIQDWSTRLIKNYMSINRVKNICKVNRTWIISFGIDSKSVFIFHIVMIFRIVKFFVMELSWWRFVILSFSFNNTRMIHIPRTYTHLHSIPKE